MRSQKSQDAYDCTLVSLESEAGLAIPDRSDVERGIWEAELRSEVENALAELSPREARVLRLSFELENFDLVSLMKIAIQLGITVVEARDLREQALHHLRECGRLARMLRPYTDCIDGYFDRSIKRAQFGQASGSKHHH